jgi:hypothetical protein
MKIEDYTQLKEWAEKLGYKLSPSVEYKVVDGVGGMYAKNDINEYDVLYSGPGSVKAEWVGNNLTLDYLSDVIREYKLGTESEIHQMFSAFETIEFFKEYSIYFVTDSELETLQQISQSAWVYAQQYRNKLKNHFEWLRGKFGNDVTDDDIIYILLNSESRAWGDGGFNPILDLFNHSSRKGNARMRVGSENRFVLGARTSYKKGEQIYDSYGQSDIYHYCAAYNFFDPSDYHCSNIVCRLDIAAESEVQKLQLSEMKKSFNVVERDANGVPKYKIINRNMVKVMDIISKNDVNTFDEPVRMDNYETSFLVAFTDWLNLVESTTNPMSVDKSKITPRLESWYNAAIKELDLIKINRSWLLNTNLNMPNFGGLKTIENLENQK